MKLADLNGAKVAVWGAGREGIAALRALARRCPDAAVTVYCRADERAVIDAALALATAPARPMALDFAHHTPGASELAGYAAVIKSPGISRYRAPLPEALAAGAQITSGSALWFAEHGSARTIGITGTKGKSTTSALVAHLLRGLGRKVTLAGNIGLPLLDLLDDDTPPDWIVIELSSFQLADLGATPQIAVVLNLYPEHLDWHLALPRYYVDKLRILGDRRIAAPHIAVLNARQTDPPLTPPDGLAVSYFGDAAGFHVRDDAVYWRDLRVFEARDWALAGAQNLDNLCAALTVLAAAGADALAAVNHARSFRALPHRLTSLGVADGLEWVDDSIATTPHATLAALAHYAAVPVTLLIGGFDRGLDWSDFRARIAARPPHRLLCFGAAGARIAQTLTCDLRIAAHVECCADLGAAIARARELTPKGGVVLLSPGAPSFDAFVDYAARGRYFAAQAGLGSGAEQIEGVGR